MRKIAVIGAGQFGTAISNSLVLNQENQVKLFSHDIKKVEDINYRKRNSIVYPNTVLNSRVTAINNFTLLKEFNVIFIAIPSYAILPFLNENKIFISDKTLVVNLAKGLISADNTIVQLIKELVPNCYVASMKGPSFAIELLNGANTLFTFGSKDSQIFELINSITSGTNIFLDFTKDIKGVELLSVFKNIYAILLGYIDAKYNSSNTRFLILTKAFGELNILMQEFHCEKETLNLACGFGDLGLTSLNDLSRNRTLGLLMGKGFYSGNHSNVVLEGEKAILMVSDSISNSLLDRLPLFSRIKNAFKTETGVIDIDFNEFMIEKKTTVLTYGTFDLLHYGHLEILSRAKNLGTELIVGLSTDKFNKVKGKTCVHNYEKRKYFLESLSYVDKVIPEENWEQKISDIKENNIDLFIMGDDWSGKFDSLNNYCSVEYLSRTPGISTTLLKKSL